MLSKRYFETYIVLVSALSDEKGIISVKLEVEEFSYKVNKLYLSVIWFKKESRYPHGNLGQNQLNTATPAYVISIADLINVVNTFWGGFLKIFSRQYVEQLTDRKQKNKALKKTEKVEILKKTSSQHTENVQVFSSDTWNASAHIGAFDDAPFQDVAYIYGAVDLIIGNVPFGKVKYNYPC